MNFDDDEGYAQLNALLEQIDKERGTQGQSAVLSGDCSGILCGHYRSPRRRMAWRSRKRGMRG